MGQFGPVRRVALHDVVLRIDGVRLGGRHHSDSEPDANGLYLGAPPLWNQKFADSLRWREMDSNFRFRVRCKRGLRRKSPASPACRRRLSAAAVGGHQLRRKAKSRNRTLIARGTGSSNPSLSSGESVANSICAKAALPMQRTCEREHRRTLGERDHHARIPHAMAASFTKSTPDASNASTPRSGGGAPR